MDFVRSYFFTNEPLSNWTLFSSKLDSHYVPNLILMKTVSNCPEIHSQRSKFLQNSYFSAQSIYFLEQTVKSCIKDNHDVKGHKKGSKIPI